MPMKPANNDSILTDYLTFKRLDKTTLTDSDNKRLYIEKYFNDLETIDKRHLFHMTITYKPYEDREYSADDVNTFFITFYTQYFLKELLSKRYYTNNCKRIQPICFSFIDEHLQENLLQEHSRLHHHAILAIHEETLDSFKKLIGENTIPTNRKQTHKICTSFITECQSMRVLYANKFYKKYEENYLIFPDKLHRERNKEKIYQDTDKSLRSIVSTFIHEESTGINKRVLRNTLAR
jgi:hypothetical protein